MTAPRPTSVTQAFQRVPIGPVVLGGRRQTIAVVRYAEDVCGDEACGHRWDHHYQPRIGGRAACWATGSGGVLCNCHAFVGTTRNELDSRKG